MLKEYNLGEEGVKYARKSLSEGNTLSKLALELFLNNGSALAYLPEGANLQVIKKFDTGGIAAPDTILEIERKVAGFISEHLTNTHNPYVVLEDKNREPTDRCLLTLEDLFFTYGSEVNYFLTKSKNTIDDIIDGLRSVSSWVFNSFLTALPGSSDIGRKEIVTAETMQALAKNSKSVVVAAFDHEAYIILSRR